MKPEKEIKDKILKEYLKESDRAFWKLAYELAKDYDLIPIRNGVYLLREKK